MDPVGEPRSFPDHRSNSSASEAFPWEVFDSGPCSGCQDEGMGFLLVGSVPIVSFLETLKLNTLIY